MPRLTVLAASVALAATLAPAAAQERGAPPGPRERGPLEVIKAPSTAGIAWIEGWKAALTEAKRSQRPIFLMSAAPACGGLPGAW